MSSLVILLVNIHWLLWAVNSWALSEILRSVRWRRAARGSLACGFFWRNTSPQIPKILWHLHFRCRSWHIEFFFQII